MVDFRKSFEGKKIFITGTTGFKGSWLASWLEKLGAKVKGYALPPNTEPSHFEVLQQPSYTVYGDVRNAEKLSKEMSVFKPDIVFHMAAQPLVRRSYREPLFTYETNVIGTLNLLEASRLAQPGAIIIVTSDKVYENNEWHWAYRENDRLGGYDLYSSSKACTEILTHSYQNSFFPKAKYGTEHKTLVATVRAGNVIGGGDWSEDRLIPDIVHATANNEKVGIRNPEAIRPWQHVLDPLAGYMTVAQHLLLGDKHKARAWNFGPENTSVKSVREVMIEMKKHWSAVNPVFPDQVNAPHEAHILKIDTSLAMNELGWRPQWTFEQAIAKTSEWYRAYYEDNMVKTNTQLDEYESVLKT